METTKILWSGLTGRTGREAVVAVRSMLDAEIALGMTRHDVNGVLDVFGEGIEGTEWVDYDVDPSALAKLITRQSEIDVIVDFSHCDVFYDVLGLVLKLGKPLIVGTSNLSDRQVASLYDATCLTDK